MKSLGRMVMVILCRMFQRQVELGTVAEAYFQTLLKLCNSQVDVSFLSSVLGLLHCWFFWEYYKYI